MITYTKTIYNWERIFDGEVCIAVRNRSKNINFWIPSSPPLKAATKSQYIKGWESTCQFVLKKEYNSLEDMWIDLL